MVGLRVALVARRDELVRLDGGDHGQDDRGQRVDEEADDGQIAYERAHLRIARLRDPLHPHEQDAEADQTRPLKDRGDDVAGGAQVGDDQVQRQLRDGRLLTGQLDQLRDDDQDRREERDRGVALTYPRFPLDLLKDAHPARNARWSKARMGSSGSRE
jgi:hypothetical protein